MFRNQALTAAPYLSSDKVCSAMSAKLDVVVQLVERQIPLYVLVEI
jgi:hypothetical protein